MDPDVLRGELQRYLHYSYFILQGVYMAKQMGSPFSEITGPGVWLVEAMQTLEDKLREMGMEVEFKVPGDEVFKWPEDRVAGST